MFKQLEGLFVLCMCPFLKRSGFNNVYKKDDSDNRVENDSFHENPLSFVYDFLWFCSAQVGFDFPGFLHWCVLCALFLVLPSSWLGLRPSCIWSLICLLDCSKFSPGQNQGFFSLNSNNLYVHSYFDRVVDLVHCFCAFLETLFPLVIYIRMRG